MASPIYYGELSYRYGTFAAPKKIPVTLIYTMNGTPKNGDDVLNGTMSNFQCVLGASLGCEPKIFRAHSTKQVKDYSRFEFSESMAQAHDRCYEEHFAEELSVAFDAGRRMVEKITD